jgi:hypothetical protein
VLPGLSFSTGDFMHQNQIEGRGRAIGQDQSPDSQKPVLFDLVERLEERIASLRHQRNRFDGVVSRMSNPRPVPVGDQKESVSADPKVETFEGRMLRMVRELDVLSAQLAQSATNLEMMV